MSAANFGASKITIINVERGNADRGCNCSGVQIQFKENTHYRPARPKADHLQTLFKQQGWNVSAEVSDDTPMTYLCVSRESADLSITEVIDVLKSDTGNVELPTSLI